MNVRLLKDALWWTLVDLALFTVWLLVALQYLLPRLARWFRRVTSHAHR